MPLNFTCACHRCHRSITDDGTCFYFECPRCDYEKLFCSPVHRGEHEAWHNRRCPEQQPGQAIAELAAPATAFPETSEAGFSQQNLDSEKSASTGNNHDTSALELGAEMKRRLSLLDFSGDEEDGADEEEGDSSGDSDNREGYQSHDNNEEFHRESREETLKILNGKGKEVNVEEGRTEIEANGPSPASQQLEPFDSDDYFIGQDDAVAASLLEQEQENATISRAIQPESSRAAQGQSQIRRSSFSWDTPDLGGDLYDISSDKEGHQCSTQASRVQTIDQGSEQVEDHDRIMEAPTGADKAFKEFRSDYPVKTESKDVAIEERSGARHAVFKDVKGSGNVVVQIKGNSENTTLTDNDFVNEAAIVDKEHADCNSLAIMSSEDVIDEENEPQNSKTDSAKECGIEEAELSKTCLDFADLGLFRTPPRTRGTHAPELADPSVRQRIVDYHEGRVIDDLSLEDMETHQALQAIHERDRLRTWRGDSSDEGNTFADWLPTNATLSTRPAASYTHLEFEMSAVQDNSMAQDQVEGQGDRQGSHKDDLLSVEAEEDAEYEMQRG